MTDKIKDIFKQGRLAKGFNEESKLSDLKKVIKRLPGLMESLQKAGVNLASGDEPIHIFGYGSLPKSPHYPPTKEVETAYLEGYSRDFCCQSIRSGTPEFTGLTLGLMDNEDGIVKGALLTYEGLDADQLLDMLTKFADREAPSTEIYDFKMLEIEKEDGTKLKALTCVANTKSDYYVGNSLGEGVGNSLSKAEKKGLSIYRKASIIARASGPAGTNFSYAQRFVFSENQKNLPLEKTSGELTERERKLVQEHSYMAILADKIKTERIFMPTYEKERLEKIEAGQWKKFLAQQEKPVATPSKKQTPNKGL